MKTIFTHLSNQTKETLLVSAIMALIVVFSVMF